MGSKNSVLTPEEIEDFTELTYLSKQEVLHCLSRFRDLVSDPDEHILSTRISFEAVTTLPELQHNPFADRLCQVFSSSTSQDGNLSFEDFLDMASALSERAPPQLKADWAFKIFDFDNDESLGPDDIKLVVKRLTGYPSEDVEEAQLTELELNKVVKYVLAEADLNKSGIISASEFRYIMSKSPDFAQNFRLRF